MNGRKSMGRTLFLLCFLISCSRTSINGEPDAQDSPDDHDVTDASCGDCDDLDPCTVDSCNPLTFECEHVPLDADEDGYAAIRTPDGTECGGDDCDDSDPDIYPGAPEVCLDGVDQDCDTVIDAFTAVTDEIMLTGDDRNCDNPVIAWTGSEFGVAWWDGGTPEEWRNEVYLARLSADGSPVGGPVRVNDDEDVVQHMRGDISLAWTGSEFGVAWEIPLIVGEDFVATSIEFARVGPDGAKRGRDVLMREWAGSPRLAWTGSRYGISWWDRAVSEDEIYFAVTDSEGMFEIDGIQISDDLDPDLHEGRPSIVWTGSEFGLTWYKSVPVLSADMVFTRIGSGGERLMDNVTITDYVNFSSSTLIWSGSLFAASWSNGNFAVFDSEGRLTSDVHVIEDGWFYGPSAAVWTGSEYGSVVYNGDPSEWSYYRISADSSESRKILQIDTDIMGPTAGGLSWTGSAFGVIWGGVSDESDDNSDVYYRLIGFCE
jgi:hypothetical protein